jgi:hypothetical protein
MTLARQCYAEDFADHVGSLEYRGLEDAARRMLRALRDGRARSQ